MANILSRIEEIAKNEGLTITSFERSIGASKGVLSRAINNGTDIQSKWIQIIVENYPQYSTDWLLTGRGEMLLSQAPSSSAVGDQHLIDIIRQQAEEIGRLKTQIEQLQNRGESAPNAKSDTFAHVG